MAILGGFTHHDRRTGYGHLPLCQETEDKPYVHMHLVHSLDDHLCPEKSPMILQSSQRVPAITTENQLLHFYSAQVAI
jgi:hypothetical protein